MNKPAVTVVVCGRFHYHKYIRFLYAGRMLRKFVYSYKTSYNFDIPRQYLQNYPLKEYLMYLGAKVLKGKGFQRYLSILHGVWQKQVLKMEPGGNIMHFLVHGNCSRIVHAYKQKGVKVIGEVVNAHPLVQEKLLEGEYRRYGMSYEVGEKDFKEKIMYELGLCDYLLVPSSFIKESLITHGIQAGKIMVIPYGLNEMAATKKQSFIQGDRPVKLLCIAQVSFRKGVVYLLEALEQLLAKGCDCSLTLVGKIEDSYTGIIGKYLLQPCVRHIPHVSNELVQPLMAEHDLFIMPSIEDGFGIVVSEALSVHLPVIVTKNCGAAEIVTEGQNGFIIEASSPAAICGAVTKAIGYRFDFSPKIPTWNDYVTELEKFYEQVLLN